MSRAQTTSPTAIITAGRMIAALVSTVMVLLVLTMPGPSAYGAAADCGFSGAVATFSANGGASGQWSDGTMWDTGTVPISGQACVPAGKTALVGANVVLIGTFGSQSLKVQGTLRVVGGAAAASIYGNSAIENTGRIEVAAGASFTLGNYGAVLTNKPGGVVRVESGGTLSVVQRFENFGGIVDLTGGGVMQTLGAGRFVHGASADVVPVQSTVVGGAVRGMQGTVQFAGTGAGAFLWPPGSTGFIEGTIAPAQTVDVTCGGVADARLYFASNVRNEGAIRFTPRASGTTCTSELDPNAGVTLTNAGTLTFGDAASPSDTYGMYGSGSVVNAVGGTMTVNGLVSVGLFMRDVTNDGTFVVNPGGTFNVGNTLFDLRDGTLTNNGTFGMYPGNTYAVLALFRLQAGSVIGNPIQLISSRLELLGTGTAGFLVPPYGNGILQDPQGPALIRPQQSLTIDDGSLATTGPIENRGVITLTGRGDGYAYFGTAGNGNITNRGRIVSTSRSATGTGGQGVINQALLNETDGVVEAQPGRTCVLGVGGTTNNGLIDLGENCLVSGVSTWSATSTLRVYSSASRLTALYDFRSGSTLGGTLDVVTDTNNPPVAGPPRDLVVTRWLHIVGGQFTTLNGSVSPTLGYALSTLPYPNSKVQLQVVPAITGVAVSAITAAVSAQVGDDVTVNWTTTVGSATSTPWTESVYLSSSTTPDASSVLLGRLRRSGPVLAGANLAGSLQVRIPSTSPGLRRLVVVVDSGLALAIPNRAGTIGAIPIQVSATPLTVGSGAVPVTVGADGTRTVANTTATLEGTRLLRLDGSPGADLIVTVAPGNAVSAWAASGRAPTSADFDVAATNGTLLVPRGDGSSPRYLLLRNSGAADVNVTVTASAPGLSITSSSPTSVLAGSPAATAVLVKGTGFTATSTARLICGATTVDATSTIVDGPTQLSSLFALPAPLGTCDVSVGAATSPNTLAVSAAAVVLDLASLKVDIAIGAPAVVRSDVDNRITVTWTNRTGYSLPAPLFVVSVDIGSLRFPGTPGVGSKRVDVLGVAPRGPAGILAPGASGSTELIVRGVGAHQTVTYSLAGVNASMSFPIGPTLVAAMSAQVPVAAQAWVEANAAGMLGLPPAMTVADFERHLGDVATTLSGLGRRSPDVARLLAFDVDRIVASGRLDAFRSGEFGLGQPGLNIPRLAVEPVSQDVIITTADLAMRFGKAQAGYLSPPGVHDVLTASGAGWVLTARDGTRRSFSLAGLLTSSTSPELRVTTLSYTGIRLASITDPTGDTTTFGYDGGGRITTITDPVGHVTTHTYDANGRQISTTSLGLTTTVTWDADGLPATVTGADGVVSSVLRDSFGRATSTRANGQVVTTAAYNADGSITATNALGDAVTTWVDDTGAVAKVVDSLGRITTTRRDAQGAPVGLVADGAPIGDLLLSDASRTISGSVDGAGGVTRTSLDADGFLQRVTDQDGRATTIARNASFKPVSLTDPAGGRTTITYDALGRPVALKDRTNRSTTTTYDGKDVITQSSTSGYGAVTLSYDLRRNLIAATGPTGTTTFTYDANDRQTSVTYPTGLGLTFAYDGAGRRTSMTSSDGNVVSATYDPRGRLATLSSGATVVARYEYDAMDRLVATGHGNGSRTEIVRDALGRTTRQRTTCCTPAGAAAGPTIVSDVQLGYDSQDRVISRTDAQGATTYSYDGASRLVGAVTTGASPRTIAYTYDGNGNRLTVSDSVSGSQASTIGPAGRPTQVGARAITHDAEGRETAAGTSAYAWDPRGDLTAATVGGIATSYTYDALGTPLTRTTAGVTTRLLMDPTGLGWLVGEFSNTGVRQAGYVIGNGLAARLDASGTTASYYATDPRGDVLALTDPAGAVTDTYGYLPFGEVAARTGTTAQPFGFMGGWGLRTEPTGLVNARARQYDPTLGRFLSEDPHLFAASNPATWASGDPLNRTDVGGTEETSATTGYPAWNPLGIAVNLLRANAAGGVADQLRTLDSMERAAANHLVGRGSISAALGGPPVGLPPSPVRLAQEAEAAEKLNSARSRVLKGPNALKALGGVVNVFEGWQAYQRDPSFANGVRQVSKAFLKTVSPPIVGLLFDSVEYAVDAGSLRGLQWLYGVDPAKLKVQSHWNAKDGKDHPEQNSSGANSGDPNEIVGPAGATVGAQRFVARDDVLPYTVLFANLPAAALPAATVTITHTLDANLDLSTFELGEVGFGANQWPAPPGVRAWSETLDDRRASGLNVRMRARLDLATRTVTWTFTSIDPVTGDQPADATRGFLPPNNLTHRGEGFVSFSVKALGTVPTGATVIAQASIVFDANAPIATNVDTVVVDAAPPSGTPSVPSSAMSPVTVTLGAVDDAGGSGVGAVDVWASKDGGPFAVAGTVVSLPSFAFTGDVGASYRFRTMPADLAGNVGLLSESSAAVQIVVAGNTPTATATATATGTATSTGTATPTGIATETVTSTATATSTPAETLTPEASTTAVGVTRTVEASRTAQASRTVETTRTPTPTRTALATNTVAAATDTPVPAATDTVVPTATRTVQPTATSTAQPTVTLPTVLRTHTPTPTSTALALIATPSRTSTTVSGVLGESVGVGRSGRVAGRVVLPDTGQGVKRHGASYLLIAAAMTIAGAALAGVGARRRRQRAR